MGDLLHAARTAAVAAALACAAQGCGGRVGVATTGGGPGGASAGGGGTTTTAGSGASSGGTSGDVTSTGSGAGGTGGDSGSGGTGEPAACASDSLGRPLITHSGGDGYTLAPALRINVVPDFFSAVLVGDVTGDGRADILGAEIDHTTLFAQGASGSPGAPAQISHAFDNPGSAALVQTGPDQILDLALISNDGLEIIPSLGSGAFDKHISLPDHYGYDLHVSDLNLDGHDDLIWIAYGDIAFAYGDGKGSFGDPVLLSPSPIQFYGPLARGDMTGDKVQDFVGLDKSLTALVVIPYDGVAGPTLDGWTKVPLPGKPCAGFDIGDVNGDGLTDVAWQEADNPDYDVPTHLMLGQPGGFAAPIEIAKAGWGGPVRIADVNADGRNDVVSLHEGGLSVTVILSTRAGMGPPHEYKFPTGASVSGALAVGDTDCDGCPDIVCADVDGLDVFRGQGCGK